MPERNSSPRGPMVSALRLFVAGLTLAALAAPAGAYVVVTSDNRVYDVASKPEVHGDLVLFTLDGAMVSLRVYDVNITKTNELNYLLDSGAGAPSLTAQLRQLRPAVPEDDRMIVSTRLDRIVEERTSDDARIARREMPGDIESFDRDRPGGRRSSDSGFSREAREALDEAQTRVRSSRATEAVDERASRDRAGRERPSRGSRAASQDSARAADLDGEIRAEQEYLRKLTAGELTVSDLEGEIDRSMDKIKRLQKRRDAISADMAEEATSAPAASGRYPAGSREARWERELADAQAELARARSQQSSASEGRDREALDERVGELQWKIDRLQKKLDRAD